MTAPLDEASRDSRLVGELHQVLVSSRIGGAGFLGIALADAARSRGATAVAWVPGAGPASDTLTHMQVPWRAYSLDRLKRGGLSQLTTLTTMAMGLAPWHRPIVHVHNPTLYGLLSPMLRRLPVTTIAHFHIDPYPGEVRWTLRHPPDVVITCSRAIGAEVSDAVRAEGWRIPVVPIPNAIDLERYHGADRQEAKREVGAPDGRALLVMLANLAEHKGQATALRALKLLKDRGVAADLWLAGEERGGEGRFTRELQALAADLEIAGDVRFLGFRSDGPDLLRAADFFLLPSTHEGLPLSVLEAQAAGAVVVASPIPGIREVVEDSVTGFLVEPADPAGYAERIQAMMQDRAAYERIRHAAMTRVTREHSWPGYVDKVWGVYADLRGRGAGRDPSARGEARDASQS